MDTHRTFAVATRYLLAIVLSLLLVAAAGCSTAEEPEPAPPAEETETAPAEEVEEIVPLEDAQYELVFDATWSAQTHPTDFPGNPHFSGLIGAVHSADTIVWEDGALASGGMKNMAETGGKTPLDSEIEGTVSAGTACELISGDGVNPSPGTTSVTFTVSEECPLVSVVTMIAPSPDWFVGVSALDMRQDGEWAEEFVIELFPWDAGTDGGTTYSAGNSATDPAEPVFLMTPAPPISVDGEIPAFGTFTFTRMDAAQ